MKRWETENWTKEKIVAFIKECAVRPCKECPAYTNTFDPSWGCAGSYLNKEVTTIPRWQTAKTQEDLDRLCVEFSKLCGKYLNADGCSVSCPFNDIEENMSYWCFKKWLSEPVEAPEEVES